MDIDFDFWAKQYEKNYDEPIEYIGDEGNDAKEKSPYFTSISKVLQKRGYLFKNEFISICEWKTKRQKRRYKTNHSIEIKKVTKNVISTQSTHPDTKELINKQINNLIQLNGVGVPVASAIMTIIFPRYYCVLDYRAWRALHWTLKKSKSFRFASYSEFSDFLDNYGKYASLKSYSDYLEKIKKLAKGYNMTPRKIEMALWKYDEKKGGL